jgi:hypothetical protein
MFGSKRPYRLNRRQVCAITTYQRQYNYKLNVANLPFVSFIQPNGTIKVVHIDEIVRWFEN